MASLPSWARVGQKVVCVNADLISVGPVDLVEGRVYEINGIGIEGIFLKGARAVNEDFGYGFKISRFRPLISKSIEDDIAIFAPLLNAKKEEELV